MFEEANAVLEEVDPFLPSFARGAACSGRYLSRAQEMGMMAIVSKKLVEWNPSEPGYFVDLAYAIRRAESIDTAHAILKRAEGLHPNDATIQLNLACYEAQTGNLDQAKAKLERATRIDPKCRRMALEDPDLKPLWDSLAAGRK